MRTSHITIKRQIADTKNKLTDEQLFASPRFSAYLTDIAEGATKRYKRSSKVMTHWDLSEDAGIAFTDNRVIHLNAGNFLTRSFPTRSLIADSLIGLVGHECGHILFSDFTMLEVYFQSLQNGRFYPNDPEAAGTALEKNLLEIKGWLNKKEKAVIRALSDISHSLVNIMEDVYIESRICDDFAGSFRTGILLNNLRFAEEMNTVQEEINRQHHEVFILMNLLIQYAKAGDINNLGGYKGPYLNVVYECIPYIDEASYDDDARVRFDAANKLLLLLWPYMKSFINQIKEDTENDTSHAQEDFRTQMAKGIPLPNGTGSASKTDNKSSTLKHEYTEDDEERERIQKVLDYEEGRIALEKTDTLSEDGDGGTEYENDFAGSGYVSQAEADMYRIMTQLAEDSVYTRYEEDLTEELQQEAAKIRFGNAHQGIHVKVNRMSYVSPEYMEAYQQIAPPLLLLSKRLQKQVSQQLKDYKSGGKLDNLPMGKRINIRNAVHKDGRIFYKRNLPNDRADIAVAVLNDESGSMSSFDRITYARAASIILHDFCESLEIPIAIYGHTEDYDVELYSYAEFESLDNKDQYRLMDMSSRSGNRDGAAIRFVAERLLQRPEAVRLLFIISDGQPAADGYHGTEAEADIRGIKQEYTRKGIRFIAAAIGSDKPNIHRIYGNCFLDITNLEKLPISLGKLIIQQIRHHIAA